MDGIKEFFSVLGGIILIFLVLVLCIAGMGVIFSRAPAKMLTAHMGTKVTAWQYFCSPRMCREVTGLEQQPLPIDARVDAH